MQQTKSQVRGRILAARRSVSAQLRASEAASLARHLSAAIPHGATVCAYVPVGAEPGSLDMLDTLIANRVTVLLPIARKDAGIPSPLRWAPYRPGELITAPFGLREPDSPWLPPERVADASTVLVPALAVDRGGVRLGRGAGFYDRTLALADPASLLVAVVRDGEVVDKLPADPHDVAMTHALTPREGLVRLASSPRE